jgi:hypothetical protein|tara:strand:- start:301 stop:540 length:240 start_codon:yes stop_codon:yes gene_type:complete
LEVNGVQGETLSGYRDKLGFKRSWLPLGRKSSSALQETNRKRKRIREKFLAAFITIAIHSFSDESKLLVFGSETRVFFI